MNARNTIRTELYSLGNRMEPQASSVSRCAARSSTPSSGISSLASVSRYHVWLSCAILLLLIGTTSAADLTSADFERIRAAQNAYNNGKQAEAAKLLEPLRSKYAMLNQLRSRSPYLYRRLLSKYPVLAEMPRLLAQADQRPSQAATGRSTARKASTSGSSSTDVVKYRKLLKEKPESGKLHWQLGNALLRGLDFRAAAVELETAWHLGQTNAQIPIKLAATWQELGDDRQALAWMQRAVSSNAKTDDLLRLELMQLCWKEKEFEHAQDAAEPLLTSEKPEVQSQVHVLLGQIALENDQVDVAIKHWEQAIETGLTSPKLIVAVGAHCYNAGDFQAAAKYLEQAMSDENEVTEENLRFLVLSLLKKGDLTNARPYLRQYIELHGLSGNARKLVRLLALTPTASDRPSEPANPVSFQTRP